MSTGEVPTLGNIDGAILFLHLQRHDDTNLVYQVQTCTNLVSNAWTNSGSIILGTNVLGGGPFCDEITNRILTVKDQTFFRLKVESR